jgi:hypothetical protein
LQRTAQEINAIAGRVSGALGALDWEARQKAGVDGQVNDAQRRAAALASQAETMARYLMNKAQAFAQADQQGVADLQVIIEKYPLPVPVPVPTPTPEPEETPAPSAFEEIIKKLDDLLKPIDWATSNKKATKVFFEQLKAIGRILNDLTGQRGYVKLMTQLGIFLRNAEKGIGFLSTILGAEIMQRYFSGQLTNAEIARFAISKIISFVAAKVGLPITAGIIVLVLTNMLADWVVQNMSDPNGRWRGPAPPVE